MLTAPKCDPNASSADIDVAVRAQAALGGPVYHINNSSVASLQPTIIITQVRDGTLHALGQAGTGRSGTIVALEASPAAQRKRRNARPTTDAPRPHDPRPLLASSPVT